MTIFLCGFMGCGKSTVGAAVAKKLGCGVCDTDEMIVKIADMSIPEIFEKKGEPYFRTPEAEVVKSLCGKTVVAACGGGAMLNADTARAARESGSKVVFLDVPFETCYERIKDDTNRPIVVRSTKEELRALYDQRRSVYLRNSTHKIDCSGSPAEISALITAAVRK